MSGGFIQIWGTDSRHPGWYKWPLLANMPLAVWDCKPDAEQRWTEKLAKSGCTDLDFLRVDILLWHNPDGTPFTNYEHSDRIPTDEEKEKFRIWYEAHKAKYQKLPT